MFKTGAHKKILSFIVCFVFLVLLITCFQNFAPFVSMVRTSHAMSSKTPLSVSPLLDIQIKDSKTFSFILPQDYTQKLYKNLTVQGHYTYPTSSSQNMKQIALEDLSLFYSCSESPKKCELTFKIPDHSPEMDLSKLYSQEPSLEISFLNGKKLIEKENTFFVKIHRDMLKENNVQNNPSESLQ